MQLNLKAVLALRAVMTEGTVTGAAQRLHRSQPVVSRLVGQLEASLGFPLFRRERQRLVPTLEGLAFYRETERAIAALAEIEATARRIRDRSPFPLRILAQSHIVHGLLNEVLPSFCARHPEFQFSIEIRQREYISQWVANQQFDIGFAPAPSDHPQIESSLLIRTPLWVVLPTAHRLSAERQISVEMLEGEPLVTVRSGIPLRTRIDAVFSDRNAKPTIRGETPSVMLACQLVARGLGVTIADPFVTSLFLGDAAVTVRALKGSPVVDYLILRRAGEQRNRMTENLIAAVKSESNALLDRVRAHSVRMSRPRPVSGPLRVRRRGLGVRDVVR